MKIGYARTSTATQLAGLEAQIAQLWGAGADRVYSEHVSAVDESRQQLEAALNYCRGGDVFIVTRLDRLSRSVADAADIERRLSTEGAALRILNPEIDTATPTGRLSFNMLVSFAQFERQAMLERQKVGIAKAKGEGKFKGRAPTAAVKAEEVFKLQAAGVGPSEIAKRLGIGRTSVYRILIGETVKPDAKALNTWHTLRTA